MIKFALEHAPFFRFTNCAQYVKKQLLVVSEIPTHIRLVKKMVLGGEKPPRTNRRSHYRDMIESNWLGGTLSGPKRPIFRPTSQIFLTVALLRPTKIRFVWQKMVTFLSQTRPR